MPGPTPAAFGGPRPTLSGDRAILSDVLTAVRDVGRIVAGSFDPGSRPADVDDIRRLLAANDDLATGPLREALRQIRPDAGWIDDEDEAGALPAGEWWVTDAVEGNINKVHGIAEFCTSATLVRDNRPVLTAVHLPMAGDTYAAVAGGGATRDDESLHVSGKRALSGAVVSSSQNGPDEAPGPARALGDAVTALLGQNAIVRVAPPPTLQLLPVAAGRTDVFWQFGAARSGLLAGALLVSEAGGEVTDLAGAPWRLDSTGFLAASPGVHAAAVALLSRPLPVEPVAPDTPGG